MVLDDVIHVEAAHAQEEQLEPFAYLPGVASKIGGLATGRHSDDPGYVFHTSYVSVGQGVAYIRLSFSGLRAREGTLVTRIHMVTGDDPPRLGLVTTDRTSLNRLMQHGELVIRFEAFHNARYAVYGSVVGDIQAEAEGLSVVLQRPESIDDPRGVTTAARNTDHGRDTARPTSKLISIEPPRIDAPVSQVATDRQLTDPVAKAWLKRLESAPEDPLELWAAVYALQTFRSYGLIQPGARGLGFGVAGSPVARLLAADGVQVVTTSEDHFVVASTAGDPKNVTREYADHWSLGRSLVNFDFLWHHQVGLHGSARNWVAGVEDAITALLPGGLAVFTFDYDVEVSMRRLEAGDSIRIGRAEVEQVALSLISRKHQVAQLKLVGRYSPLVRRGHSMAGLVVRRAELGR